MDKNDISQKPDGSDYHVRKFFTLWIETLEESVNERLKSIQSFFIERDRRYEERFKAQENSVALALTAIDKQHTQATTASEKAIEKALEAQAQYNQSHNDLIRKMDGQYKEMIPRTEHEGDIKNILGKHDELKKDVQEQGNKFFRRDEYLAYTKATDAELRSLRDFKITLESKASQGSVYISYVIAGIGVLLSIISLVRDFIK